MIGMPPKEENNPFPEKRPWKAVALPVTPYETVLNLQHRLLARRIDGSLSTDTVILCEHPPVFTLGRRGGRENLKVPFGFIKKRGIPLIQAERGGNITYHGPGQLVAYFIVDLGRMRLSIPAFVERLETIMIRLSARWGVAAHRRPENRGIWVGSRKLGSVGIAVRRNVTFHGLALNVKPDLTPFSWIAPCGLHNVRMTSLARETGKAIGMHRIRTAALNQIETAFGVSLTLEDLHTLCTTTAHDTTILPSKAPLDTDTAPLGPGI